MLSEFVFFLNTFTVYLLLKLNTDKPWMRLCAALLFANALYGILVHGAKIILKVMH